MENEQSRRTAYANLCVTGTPRICAECIHFLDPDTCGHPLAEEEIVELVRGARRKRMRPASELRNAFVEGVFNRLGEPTVFPRSCGHLGYWWKGKDV